MKKRILGFILSIIMVFSLFPAIAMAEDVEGQINDDGFVPLSQRDWTTTSVENWNVNGEGDYPPAMEGEETNLYIKVGSNYYPVSTERYTYNQSTDSGYYLKQIASPANPLEFTPENWKYYDSNTWKTVSTSTADKLKSWGNWVEGYTSKNWVYGDDGNLYQLRFNFRCHTKPLGIAGFEYYEFLPYYKVGNTRNELFYENEDNTAWQSQLYSNSNDHTNFTGGRNAAWDGWFEYGQSNYGEHNSFLYDVYEKVSANMILFKTNSYYENNSGNKHILAIEESVSTDASWNGVLFYKAKEEESGTEEVPLAEGNSASADVAGLHLDKSLNLNTENGSYSIQLEAYANGALVSSKVPSDIVLVADQSGSMSDPLSIPAGYYFVNSVSYNDITKRGAKEYYIRFDDDPSHYYPVSAERTTWAINIITPRYSFWYTDGTGNHYLVNDLATHQIYSNRSFQGRKYKLFYYQNASTVQRVEALEMAANNFMDQLSNELDENNEPINRVALVGFSSDSDGNYSNTEVFNGPKQINYNSVNNHVYKNALKWTDAEGIATLRQSTSMLTTDAGTYVQYGLELAKGILDNRTDDEKRSRNAVVILFTDGVPGDGRTSYNRSDIVNTANAAISKALEIKQGQQDPEGQQGKKYNKAKIFTVGVFTNDNAKIHDNSTYTIKDYMEAVSSKFPDAVSLSNKGDAETDVQYYDYTTGNTGGSSLDEIFARIQASVSSAAIDTAAVLKDVIDTDNFSFPESSNVKVETLKGTQASQDGDISWENDNQKEDITGNVTINRDSDSVAITGFDYGANYIGYGKAANSTEGTLQNQGKKIIVTIDGLLPKTSGEKVPSNKYAGIYENSEAKSPLIQVDRPWITIADKTFIADFNAKLTLLKNVEKFSPIREENGDFAFASPTLSYQLKSQTLANSEGNVTVNLKYEASDKGMVYTSGNMWNQVNVIPANNIYFDDDLLDESVDIGDGSGKNDEITSSHAERIDNAAVTEGTKYLNYVFTGTGIDVYCTTTSSAGYVRAALYNSSDEVIRDPAPVTMRNYSITDRYNVPTISFTGLPYGTYRLMILVPATVNYQLDGARVYNAMGTSEESQQIYKNTDEANAVFVNLRERLLNNDGQEYAVSSNDGTEANEGVLFIDDVTQLSNYDNAFTGYRENSPKNEIYLSKNQAITFQLGETDGHKYWVGLSAPDKSSGSSGKVLINSDETLINSPVDMYYAINPGTDGSVTIKNTSDTMISVTNLKVTTPITSEQPNAAPPSGKRMFRAVSMRTIALAANDGNDPDSDEPDQPGEIVDIPDEPENPGDPVITPDEPELPEETADPAVTPSSGIQNTITKLISNLIKAIFKSFSKLFR